MAEARRVLRSGGSFVFNVWDRIEENEFADVVTEAAAGIFPNDPPRFMARTLYGYHDVYLIRRDVSEAGFAEIEIATITEVGRAPSPRHPAVAYCQGTPLRNEIEARDPARLDDVTDHATAAIADRFGDGAVEAKIQGFVVTAQV